MRKSVLVMFVAFTASVFGVSSVAQRRARRGRARPAAAATRNEPPQSAHIQEELGGLRWGMTKDEVLGYFRQTLTARYQPLLRNKGQVEQDRLLQERDRELEALRRSYVAFNGSVNQRRWDTSFIGEEYTHNNSESMLVREDPRTGDREFFFFLNDRLWKRFQARAIPSGSQADFPTFVGGLDQVFGAPGLRRNRPNTDRIEAVLWQDRATRLRVVDQSMFYNAYCLVYEERATLDRLAQLRRNQPAKTVAVAQPQIAADEPRVGNVEADQNADIVDRLTGKMRRVQDTPANGQRPAAAGAGTGTNANGNAGGNANGGRGNANYDPNDPLRGL